MTNPIHRLDYSSAGATRQAKVLPDLTQPTVLELELAALKAENAKLKAKATQSVVQGLTFRVSAKGAVSVYGMGRWPVTLYAEQWAKLAGHAKDIAEFIEANKASLSFKQQD